MNKKKTALTACAAALAGTLAIGGTLAYLTSRTSTVENVFTGEDKNLGGRIDEKFDEKTASKYMPGDLIVKEPVLENLKDSVDAYVAVKVDFSKDNTAVDYDTFKQDATVIYQGAEGFNTVNWKEVPVKGADYKFFVYKDVVKADTKTAPIFDHIQIDKQIKVEFNEKSKTTTVWKEVTKEDYENAAGNKQALKSSEDENEVIKYYVQESVTKETFDPEENYYVIDKDGKVTPSDSKKIPDLKVNVIGYMVQARNLTIDEAVTELLNLVKN